jgi:hypothetical protein
MSASGALIFATRRDRANRVTTTMFRLTGELRLLYVAAVDTGLLVDGVSSFLIPRPRRKSEDAGR